MKRDLINELTISSFNGNEICTYIFEGRVCYVGLEIAKLLDYSNPSKAVQRCILGKLFQEGIEYDILTGNRLKIFKRISFGDRGDSFTRVPKIIILYGNALNDFFAYSGKEKADEYKKWFKNNIEEIHKKFNLVEHIPKAMPQNLLSTTINTEVSDDRKENQENLNEVLRMIENLYIIGDKSKESKESVRRLLNLAKYLIDELQN